MAGIWPRLLFLRSWRVDLPREMAVVNAVELESAAGKRVMGNDSRCNRDECWELKCGRVLVAGASPSYTPRHVRATPQQGSAELVVRACPFAANAVGMPCCIGWNRRCSAAGA